jgi:hypothetical protein
MAAQYLSNPTAEQSVISMKRRQPPTMADSIGDAGPVLQPLTLTIEPDELLGLTALAELDVAHGGKADPGVATEARMLMRRALADKLDETGLPWAPSAEAVRQCAAQAVQPPSAMVRLAESRKVRKGAAYVLTAVALLVLSGGYFWRWAWTGLPSNYQLWNWLQVLLLPAVLGTIPLWMKYGKHISRGRRVITGAAAAACIGLVILGYLLPAFSWTGFRGQKLSNWLQLLLIPAAVAITTVMVSRRDQLRRGRRLRPYQRWIAAALVAGWIVTLIGGYRLGWTWTGYEPEPTPPPSLGSMWDWLVLALPMAFPIILLPSLSKWVTGDAAGRAAKEEDVIVAGTAAAPEITSAAATAPGLQVPAQVRVQIPRQAGRDPDRTRPLSRRGTPAGSFRTVVTDGPTRCPPEPVRRQRPDPDTARPRARAAKLQPNSARASARAAR